MIVNNARGLFLDTSLLWDMMILLLGFRVDKYMELKTSQLSEVNLKDAKNAIKDLCNQWGASHGLLSNLTASSMANPSHPETASHPSARPSTLATVFVDLSSYIDLILGSPQIARASNENRSEPATHCPATSTPHRPENNPVNKGVLTGDPETDD